MSKNDSKEFCFYLFVCFSDKLNATWTKSENEKLKNEGTVFKGRIPNKRINVL